MNEEEKRELNDLKYDNFGIKLSKKSEMYIFEDEEEEETIIYQDNKTLKLNIPYNKDKINEKIKKHERKIEEKENNDKYLEELLKKKRILELTTTTAASLSAKKKCLHLPFCSF